MTDSIVTQLRKRKLPVKTYELHKLRNWIDVNKLNWYVISGNLNAIHLLEQNLDKIDWDYLSGNPNAIYLLEQNPDKINWSVLSGNPNAIHLLEKNQDKIDYEFLSRNPSIFVYNYVELKRRMKETIAEDLMKNRFHPKNMDKWVGWGQEDEIEFAD